MHVITHTGHRATGLFMVAKCSAFTVNAEKATVAHPLNATHKNTKTLKKKFFLNISVITFRMCKAIWQVDLNILRIAIFFTDANVSFHLEESF